VGDRVGAVMTFLSSDAQPERRIRRLICAAAVAAIAPLAGCSHQQAAPAAAPSAAAPSAAAPSAAAPSAAAPAGLTFTLPLASAKGYHGSLVFNSSRPKIVLGDPGRIGVSAPGLTDVSATVSNTTEAAAQPAVLLAPGGAEPVTVVLTWKLPPALAQDATLPALVTSDCRTNCQSTASYILEQVNLAPVSHSQPVEVGQSVGLTATDSNVALGDKRGATFLLNGSDAKVPANFPTADQSVLEALLSGPPDAIYVTGGFTLGSATGDTQLGYCQIALNPSDPVTEFYGVIDGHTGQILQGTAALSLAGQPCNSSGKAPSPWG
jgi:hypothetical protein